MVNGKVVDAKDTVYLAHEIVLPRELLKEGDKNRVEVIF